MRQTIQGHTVRTLVHKLTGQRYIALNESLSACVPVEIARLATGKDAWLRGVLVPCDDCGNRVPVGETECNLCPDCYEKAERQIEIENS